MRHTSQSDVNNAIQLVAALESTCMIQKLGLVPMIRVTKIAYKKYETPQNALHNSFVREQRP